VTKYAAILDTLQDNYVDCWSVRIEMRDPQGRSIFGAIEQDVVRYGRG
jgi:hypothetical protein